MAQEGQDLEITAPPKYTFATDRTRQGNQHLRSERFFFKLHQVQTIATQELRQPHRGEGLLQ